MKISLEEIISLVVKEVIAELNRRGIQIDNNEIIPQSTNIKKQKVKLRLSEYKTPLLTEEKVLELDSSVTEIEIPIKTIITPSAQDMIRKREILITKK